MNSIFKPTVDVALVGFDQHERTLLASLFSVSSAFGSHAYREWKPDQKPRPDCVLLDREEQSEDLEQGDASAVSVAVGGTKAEENPPVVMRIHRPFRCSEILQMLDNAIAIWRHHDSTCDASNASAATLHLSSGGVDADAAVKPCKRFKTAPAVLVINPNPVGWRYITARLAESGYRVDHVSSGERALTLLAEYRYNGIILEPMLPDMDGFEICKLVKRSGDRRRTSTIILTTSRNPVDRIRGTAVGCDAFFSRPIYQEQLRGTLEKLLPGCRTV